MSIFRLAERICDEYTDFVRSFYTFSDQRIWEFVEEHIFRQRVLCPEVLVQLNPNYEEGDSVKDLCDRGLLHPLCAEIFYDENKSAPIRLFRHQQEAIQRALRQEHFVITSGTGSGKTLTYFIPIFNAVLNRNPEERSVRAIIVYPTNALVNSQKVALERLKESFERRTGRSFPVRFAPYTGQETPEYKEAVRKNPPHILLTNYVMLELILVRPEERHFVSEALEFLVIDELHSYRGRQGADVAMLIRRVRKRSGNDNLLCIGTSATMVAGEGMGPEERRRAVAEFATKLFGVPVKPENVVEERLQRLFSSDIPTTPDALRRALHEPLPETTDEVLRNPLAAWVERTFGIEEEPDGTLRRRTPITLKEGAKRLAQETGEGEDLCLEKLKELLLKGAKLRLPNGNPVFALKLHQFIAQARSLFATLEPPQERVFSLEGQYYAPDNGKGQRVFFPLVFCRVCGQDYYSVLKDNENQRLLPREPSFEIPVEGDVQEGYLMLAPENPEEDWSQDYLPDEWLNQNGRVRHGLRGHVPVPLWVRPDGTFSAEPTEGAVKGWFQPRPFLLCLNCGEFYTRRDRQDFRKLASLSSEGRSSATTVVVTSTLQHAPENEVPEENRKVLSFTDNRQDASLQAGHFNDFVQVVTLRSALYAALERHKQLTFEQVPDAVVKALGVTLNDIARKKNLDPRSPTAKDVCKTFRELVQYRLYEDLRRGWRVTQPNLEQCGLLRIAYKGLKELCNQEDVWEELPTFKKLSPTEREKLLTTILDHFRKKLAIDAPRLNNEQFQSQLRQRVQAHIDEKWGFEENERLWKATKFALPGQNARGQNLLSLSERSLLGRYLRRQLGLSVEEYRALIPSLLELLCKWGLLVRRREHNIITFQLSEAALLWCLGDGTPPPPDPIYSRRAVSSFYREVQRHANEFFQRLYREVGRELTRLEGREHTAQIAYENRQEREERFREGTLSVLFCSPTMELGIDIADLQLVHLRNVPPTPANYAQRSGRAGRRGDPALVLTYCSAYSAHDTYFFRNREKMVAGNVRTPQIDLSNEALLRAHVHAIWLAKTGVRLGSSVPEVLDVYQDGYPLKPEIRSALKLSPERLQECFEEARSVIFQHNPDLEQSGWFTDEWLKGVLARAPEEFDRAFDRWRELYQAAQKQWLEANEILQHPIANEEVLEKAQRQRSEAERQMRLLCQVDVTPEESDFYPYRYLASEGFLPGYNFPTLPLRAYIPRGEEGEFISRPRFLAVTEFGPRNIIYHEGAKYQVVSFFVPPGGLAAHQIKAKLCHQCGYFLPAGADLCDHCRARLDAFNSEFVELLEMTNVRTWRRERITCEEEERLRMGYNITSHFRFAEIGGQRRCHEAIAYDRGNNPLLRLIYAPTAELYVVNHGWRNRREIGFYVNLQTGEIERAPGEEEGPPFASHQTQVASVRLFVRNTANLLVVSPVQQLNERALATLQYALQRGMETLFQVEERELVSYRIGRGEHRSILFVEAAEGGLGVLKRLVEPDTLAQVARAALERCHFDPETLKDLDPDCLFACYDCLLSYTNQRDHDKLNRHAIVELLKQLSQSHTQPVSQQRGYDEHYRWLRTLTDRRSPLERQFIEHLYRTRRRLPDHAQHRIEDPPCAPDFFYEPNICVFCDGPYHDKPEQQAKDEQIRRALRDRGYEVIVIRYDRDLEEQISAYPDVFGKGTTFKGA